MDPVRDNFLRSLSNYSECIKPYMRQVQEKYVASYYLIESGKVDINSYCVKEKEQAIAAKDEFLKTSTY